MSNNIVEDVLLLPAIAVGVAAAAATTAVGAVALAGEGLVTLGSSSCFFVLKYHIYDVKNNYYKKEYKNMRAEWTKRSTQELNNRPHGKVVDYLNFYNDDESDYVICLRAISSNAFAYMIDLQYRGRVINTLKIRENITLAEARIKAEKWAISVFTKTQNSMEEIKRSMEEDLYLDKHSAKLDVFSKRLLERAARQHKTFDSYINKMKKKCKETDYENIGCNSFTSKAAVDRFWKDKTNQYVMLVFDEYYGFDAIESL